MDKERTVTFLVTVTTNASKEKYKREAALGILRSLNSRFYPSNIRLRMGKSDVRYDALADDGHHGSEHSKTLQIKTPDSDWEEWK